jgi:hypothetical protein
MISRDHELLNSDAEAAAVGHAEGKEFRANTMRKGILNPDLAEHIDVVERGYPDQRGHRCHYNTAWRRGFEAGFLGRPVPS